MEENINLSLFKDFFQSSSPADYAKELINTKNPDENKEHLAGIKNRISDLKDRIKKNQWNRKKKNADETLKIAKKIIDYNKNNQKHFSLASKVDKEKSEPKSETSIAERTILKKGMVAEIEKEEKNIDNELFKSYFTIYQSPSDMYKKLHETEGKKK